MNVITLTGNATKDIEIKYTPSGKSVAKGTIAVKRDYKNQNGEYETDFIDFVAIGKTAEIMSNHINKGDKFGITGRLQIRKWEKENGEVKYYTEVLVNGFDFPNKARKEQSNVNTFASEEKRNTGNYDPFSNGSKIDIDDNDLPF